MHIGAGGYASDLWMNSLTVAYLKTHPLPDAQIYSNFPDAVYFFSGHPAKLSPTRESAEHKESYKGAYLVWFENRWREDLFDFKELRSVFKMETLTQCPDGGIYIIH